MWSQIRHDKNLEPLSWFGNMPMTSIKWSTAGDAYVNDKNGSRVVVMGKSGNAPLRTQAGVYCNVRPYGPITVVDVCLVYHILKISKSLKLAKIQELYIQK